MNFDTSNLNGAIESFCKKWKVTEFSLFGSVLRDDFGPDSDIDVLVSFEPDTHWTLFDLVHMEDELSAAFGRPVDVVLRKSVERSRNSIRREGILSNVRQIYPA